MPVDVGGYRLGKTLENYFNLVVEYLVIAGGGGGGNSSWPGGGGAGGYRSSISGENSGGGASAESPLSLPLNTPITVSIGSGGALGSNGSNTTFHNITCIGGGKGGILGVRAGDGGSGGGGGNNVCPGYGQGTPNQGYDGVGGDEGCGGLAMGGGGAGGTAPLSGDLRFEPGGPGLASSVTGTSVIRAGGGGGQYAVGGGHEEDANGSAASNTGGGGRGYTGTGGSGVVILRYPSSVNCNTSPGITSSTVIIGSNKVTTITSGTGTVSFS